MKTYKNVEMKIVLLNHTDVLTGSFELPEVEIFSFGGVDEAFD